MSRRKLSRKKDKVKGMANEIINSYYIFLDIFANMSMSLFKFKNLPEKCNERWINYNLFYEGVCVFFEEEVTKDILCLPGALTAPLDINNEPTTFNAHTPNGSSFFIEYQQFVPLYYNLTRRNGFYLASYYAEKIALASTIADQNTNLQKMALGFKMNSNNRLTVENIMEDYDGMKPYILESDGINVNDFLEVINPNIPFIAPQLNDLQKDYFNEALCKLGIPAVGMYKRERMLDSEIKATMGIVKASQQSRLISFELAIEKTNKMFGTNIDFYMNEEFKVNDSIGEV